MKRCINTFVRLLRSFRAVIARFKDPHKLKRKLTCAVVTDSVATASRMAHINACVRYVGYFLAGILQMSLCYTLHVPYMSPFKY